MYKSKLQELCQQQKWPLPEYTCIKHGGDDHRCPQFKASVVVAGLTFDTPSAATSSKHALNEAARLALLHFSSDEKISSSTIAACCNISDKELLRYKSKLQELCQKEKWGLPKYTCMRDGADHCPQFKASAVVRGVAFDSPAACSSSKQALNQVAQLAFLHFTSSEPSNETNCGKEDGSTITSEDESVKNYINMQEGFKNKLKMYAEMKGLKLPLYSTEKEGHCFKARVSVGDGCFSGDKLSATAEEAQNSAAATALLAFFTASFHENDPLSYKMLLHKLASNEGFFSPSYKTIRSNESDCIPFVCTVEVEGELFEGTAAESVKLAELNAAKAAYTSFIERKLFQPHYQILRFARRLESSAISDARESATDGSPPSSLISDTGLGTDHETDDVGNCGMKNGAEMKSYLLCNKVRVFTCMPNMALPEGVVVLPIGEDRWATVALEFSNEKVV
ncbi:hypothetical protein C2S51_013226 [Perilla frutescens var. frutescens]|nr:hypothetical protein C2S51_013226 [Perilla frutescens var. frutescens]